MTGRVKTIGRVKAKGRLHRDLVRANGRLHRDLVRANGRLQRDLVRENGRLQRDLVKAYHAVLKQSIPPKGKNKHGGLRLHMSVKAIHHLATNTRVPSPHGNAFGLWYAFDADWIDLQEGSFSRPVGRFAYDLHLDPRGLTTSVQDTGHGATRKVLVIRDLQDAVAFQRKYVSESGWSWPAVKRDFAGFEIRFPPPQTYDVLVAIQKRVFGLDPDGFQKTLDFKNNSKNWMSWLHDMDIPSGCIWNTHVIQELHPLPILGKVLASPAQVARRSTSS